MTRRAWALLTVATTALAGCQGVSSAELSGYSVGPGSNEITVWYGTGSSDEPGLAEILRQDDRQVTISVSYRRADGVHNAALVIRGVVVELEHPLGDRSVVNEAGDQVRECTADTFYWRTT